MPKNKKVSKKVVLDESEEKLQDLPFAPPDLHYLSERYIVKVPLSQAPMENRWELRLYAEKELERRLGDEVQLTSMRVHKPHLISKTKAHLLRQEPVARLVVTVKF
jgi:hypothetical protein